MSDVDSRYTDKRTAERYQRYGQLDEKAFEKHLKALPDLAAKCESVTTFMEDDVMENDPDDADLDAPASA
jgi:hypothetical protein